MSYFGSSVTSVSNVSISMHQCNGASPSAGNDIPILGTSQISQVAITNNDAVLDAGASYYLECSGVKYARWSSAKVQWYNQTTAAYVGQFSWWLNPPNGQVQVTRWVSRALILSGDFGVNSTMTLSPRTISITSGSYMYSGYTEPHVRIWRIA